MFFFCFLKSIFFVFNQTYLKKVRQKPGICNISNGKNFYQACIKFHTSFDTSAEDIHDLGQKEVARIKENMMKIFKEEDLPLSIPEASKILFERKELYCKTAVCNFIYPNSYSFLYSLETLISFIQI